MIGAEAHAEFAQGSTRFLRQAPHIFGNKRPVEHAQMFADLKSDAARNSFEPLARFEVGERTEMFLHMLAEPKIEPALHRLQRRAGELLVCEHMRLRRKDVITCSQLGDRFAEPTDRAVAGEHEGFIDGFADARCALIHFGRERFLRGSIQRSRGFSGGLRIGREAETLQEADMLAFDHHVAGIGYFRFKHRILSEAAHQHAGAPVDETLG